MMLRKTLQWVIITAFLLVGTVSRAHEGREHDADDPSVRAWTFADSGVHIHGAYLASRDGKVQVRRSDGTVVFLEIEKLTIQDQKWTERKAEQVKDINENVRPTNGIIKLVVANAPIKPGITETFEPFAKRKAIKYRQDDKYFYVESNSMPDHPMMVGITAWQQQVPIPQPYFGDNAWRIPLEPVVAKNPMSAKSHFFRGAIALAANGVPIFNPIKNDGRTDTLLAGELDEFGGHCGRGDDYHYHIAPTHLQVIVGNDKPIAYALDGYPIYGYTEPDGAEVRSLDDFNGHSTPELGYHYHATKTYPYLNGGFYGEVKEVDGQVDPQPRAGGVREALPPLRGAKITGFESKDNKSFSIKVEVGRETRYVNYLLNVDGSVKFDFIDGNGNLKSETYSPRQRGPGAGGGDRRGGPGSANNRPPRNDPPPRDPPPPDNVRKRAGASAKSNASFVVSSTAIGRDTRISSEFTCDGESVSPPIEWKGAPMGTKSFALSLWHTAPDQEKSYWLIYNIPAKIDHLDKNDKTTGTIGLNDKKKASYEPMCSKGPGAKTYHVTVYALSAEVNLAKGSDNRVALLKAIKDITLAETTLDFVYERQSLGTR
jgi:Raf kinase inhibitor-like YbhB/YbcL family protein